MVLSFVILSTFQDILKDSRLWKDKWKFHQITLHRPEGQGCIRSAIFNDSSLKLLETHIIVSPSSAFYDTVVISGAIPACKSFNGMGPLKIKHIPDDVVIQNL